MGARPHKNAQSAYELKLRYRYQWTVIARICGLANASTALRAARRYSAREGLAWPLPGWECRAQMAYEDRLEGDSWIQIEAMLFPGEAYQSRARGYARRWAARNNMPWPV